MKFRVGIVLAVTAALGSSCATKTVAPPVSETAPAADSPANAVRSFEWAFVHRDMQVVAGLLTDDFLFVAASTDSSGTVSDTSRPREWFLGALDSLTRNAEQVTILLDQNLVPFPDS